MWLQDVIARLKAQVTGMREIDGASSLDAAMRGEDGRVRVLVTASPDGTVRSVRMLMPSTSPSLNSGTTRPFNGARLPAFPPGSDPNGVTIELTVDYVLIRGR